MKVEIPQAAWEPIFFQKINERAKQANLSNLRATVLPDGDVEARFWLAVGYHGMDGLVLQRTSGAWTALYLHGLSKNPNLKADVYEEMLPPPQSGWDAAWQNLVDAGTLTMPDASKVGCNVFGKDGIGFIVETNAKGIYRTYFYDDPAFAQCDEAKKMLNVVSTLNQEFRLDWPTAK